MVQPDSIRLAEAVAATLAHHVTDVVLCPGSRNSPLSLALLARRDLRVHTRIDERGAAFTALGIARVQGHHVAVVTTSGTAVANCAPAIIEAAHSHVPLTVLSADRPRRLVGTGASQTIDQVGVFTPAVETVQVERVADVDKLDAPLSTKEPAHINVAFDTPLVGDELPEPVGESGPRRLPPLFQERDYGTVDLDLSKDTLVIAGDEAWEVEGLAEVPTIAEPTAPAPFHAVHPLAAEVFVRGEVSATKDSEYAEYVATTKPEQLVVVGHPTLHRSVMKLIADPEIDVTVLTRTDTATDPTGNATRVASHVKVAGQPRKQWLNTCRGASEIAAAAVRSALEDPEFGFTGLHVAAAVTDGLGIGDTVVLGSSNPVRDAALTGLPFGGVDTYSPRGTAGIDGTIAQSIGIALATQSLNPDEVVAPRTIALLGDVTFCHDASSLLLGVDQPRPENLTIVVANDDGGGIFEALEVGQDSLRTSFEKAFGTPHGLEIAALCDAYDTNYRRADDLRELIEILNDLIDKPDGITVVEARTTRETRRALDEQLKKATGMRL